jgi:hypothetical protein
MTLEEVGYDERFYDYTEWELPRLRRMGKQLMNELKSKRLPVDALATVDHDLGHLAFEMWCRKQELASS